MIESKKYQLNKEGKEYYKALDKCVAEADYKYLVNPCGEISLRASGGYCIISDIVPFHCDSLEEVLESGRLAARFLLRVNMMDSLYGQETKRTMRIGVCMTGIHEFAWSFFGLGFKQMLDLDYSEPFWNFIYKLGRHIEQSANEYADELGVNRPHTVLSSKPSGSVSKLFALTEGAHLPAYHAYIRWVQFANSDPLIEKYREKGYPVMECKSYPNMTRVGFPTVPAITKLGMGENMVIASEATPEEQYKYLMLLEKYWLNEGNNQISYTLKFEKNKLSKEDFEKYLLEYQSQIRCCSVMPVESESELKSRYEYLPEESITEEELYEVAARINDPEMEQIIDIATLQCASGACPL